MLRRLRCQQSVASHFLNATCPYDEFTVVVARNEGRVSNEMNGQDVVSSIVGVWNHRPGDVFLSLDRIPVNAVSEIGCDDICSGRRQGEGAAGME